MGIRLLTVFLAGLALSGQVRKLHTRDLTRLSHLQVAEQLKKSDVIFIPVGAVETNGIQPSDRDYVYALSLAMTMAEETGGLYMPGLAWSYPGTTLPAPSTIGFKIGSGTAFLKETAHSLLRQGFRRQVYLSMSHGPAALTAGTLVREFYDEARVPLLYINMDEFLPKIKVVAADRDKFLYGAHMITGRLEDLALKGDYGETPHSTAPPNEGLAKLGKLGFSGSLYLGSWINDVLAHGGSGTLPATAAEREAWGQHGAAQIRSVVKRMQLPGAMEALRQHDRYTQDVIVPRLREWLR
ncbi:MAG: creatininase family protein [Acidobacteria bacterium]|nr:creatininase family protein [Acidobacteriota bacterium]